MKHLRILVCGLALQCSALPATANWLYTPGTGPSAFVSFNSGTTPAGTGLCAAANTDCLANVPIALSGQPLFTAGTPGIVTANAGTNLNTSLLALESGGNLATLAGAITAARIQANVSQINGVTPLMGNGVTGTGSQRVTIASDNTAFSVNATLQASAATVIGTVRNLGNAGAITDFAGQNAASPANAWLMGGQFQTTPTTITPGNASPFQMDNAGNLLVNVKVGGAGGGAVTVANGADVALGSTTDNPATCTVPTSATACTQIQLLKQLLNTSSFPTNITATDCSVSTATGGTAQNAFAASSTKHGFFLFNISDDDGWMSFTGTASPGGTGSYPVPKGTGIPAVGGGSFSAPPGFGLNSALSVYLPTTGDKWTCTYY